MKFLPLFLTSCLGAPVALTASAPEPSASSTPIIMIHVGDAAPYNPYTISDPKCYVDGRNKNIAAVNKDLFDKYKLCGAEVWVLYDHKTVTAIIRDGLDSLGRDEIALNYPVYGQLSSPGVYPIEVAWDTGIKEATFM